MNFSISRFLGLCTLILSCNAAIPSAHAADLDAKGQELKTQLSGMIDYEKSALSLGGNRLETKGDVTVEKKEGYYAAKLPVMNLYNPQNERVDLGTITINAVPDDNDKRWKMAVSLPSGFSSYDAQGVVTGKSTIGTQKFNGVWDTTLKNFVVIDAQYDKVSILDLKANITSTIETVTGKLDAKQDPQGNWGGPFNISLHTLSLSDAAKKIDGKIGQIDIASTFSGYSIKDAQTIKDKVVESGKAASAAQAAGQQTVPSLEFFGDMLNNSGNSMTSAIVVKDINFTVISGEKKIPSGFKLGAIGFDFNMSGLKEDAVKALFRTNYSGLEISPPSTGFASVAPNNLDIGFEISGLPIKEMTQKGTDPAKLSQDLAKSNAELKITAFKLASIDYLVDFNGALKSNSLAPGLMTGDINGKIKGLQGLITKLSALAQTLPQEQQGKAMFLMMPLSMIDSMGKPDAADATLKTYAVKLMPDGTATVNGIALGGPKPADTAQEKSPVAVKPAKK